MKKAEVQIDQTVCCPYCRKKTAGGNAVDFAARQKLSMTCRHCGKQFRPVLPKKKK